MLSMVASSFQGLRLALDVSATGAVDHIPAITHEVLLSPPYHFCGGRQWIAALPDGLPGACDTAEAPKASMLRLCEDGVEVGPAHTQHAEIERHGAGRYSHWNGALRFSTTDASDPNANGRRYTIFREEPLLKLLGIGSCHMADVMTSLDARELAHAIWQNAELCYSPRQLLQLIEVNAGRLEVPAELHAFATAPQSGPGCLSMAVSRADAIVLELGTCADIAYGPFWLQRGTVETAMRIPIAALGPDESRIASRWLFRGIYKQEEAIRSACVPLLLDYIERADIADRTLVADIVTRARGARQTAREVVATLRQVFDSFGRKADLVVSSNNVFTPDGRGVSWPTNFPRALEAICRELDVPLLHSSRMVAEHGAAFALKPDLHHFTPDFLRVLGERILEMVRPAGRGADRRHGALVAPRSVPRPHVVPSPHAGLAVGPNRSMRELMAT